MRLLVADDDLVSRSLMRRMLVQHGYEVVEADNGRDASEILLKPGAPRLALLDWEMPGLNGPEVCRITRERCGEYVYLVLLTSKDSRQAMVAGLDAGADDYLTKPCHFDELSARLRTGQRILDLQKMLVDAREEMRYRAMHDPLTGLLNRGAIVQECGTAFGELERSGGEFGVLLCDVDHFKRINDTHGHPVGDEVLKEVGRRLTGCTRDGDRVGRYGGEEFLVVVRDSVATGCVERRAEGVCDAMRGAFLTSAGQLELSISVGALGMGANHTFASVDEVLSHTDRALYAAKRRGRNQVVMSSSGASMLAAAAMA